MSVPPMKGAKQASDMAPCAASGGRARETVDEASSRRLPILSLYRYD